MWQFKFVNMVTTNFNQKKSYVRPAMETITLEMESSILAGSINVGVDDPLITNPDMGWGTSKKSENYNDFWSKSF